MDDHRTHRSGRGPAKFPRPSGHLDPARDPDGWEARVHSIMAAAGPALERHARQRPALPMLTLIDWARPLIATATIIAAIAVASLLTTPSGASSQAESVGSVAEAITPEPVAAWLLVGVVPTTEELIGAIQGGKQ